MTIRLNENNIIDYLRNFNKNHIRQSKHSNSRRKRREFPVELIIELISKKSPIHIEQQETKLFALTYPYTEDYNIYIVVAIKDKFINLVTQHKISKERSLKK